MNTILKDLTHEQWLEERSKGLGSSEVGTLMGVNPYETPYQLWRRKKGLEKQKEENFLMTAGHYLEPAVAQFWQDATGKEIIKSSAGDWIVYDNDKPYLRVSPDRTFWADGKKEKGILECKTTQKDIDKEDIPRYWFCQVQYQLGVAQMQQGSLAWLCSGRKFDYQDIKFNPDFYGVLVEEISKFWTDYIIGNKEPQISSVDDLLIKYPQETKDKEIEADTDIKTAYDKLTSLRSEIKRLEEEENKQEELIKMTFLDAERLTYQGKTLATWKKSKATTKFDAKTFQKDNPELAERYMITSEGSRRFLIK